MSTAASGLSAASPALVKPKALPPPGSFDACSQKSATDSIAYVWPSWDGIAKAFFLHVPPPLIGEYESERRAMEDRLIQHSPPGLQVQRSSRAPCGGQTTSASFALRRRTASLGEESTSAGSAAHGSSVAFDAVSDDEALALPESDSSPASAARATRSLSTRNVLTTVIVRRIPKHFTRAHVIDMLDRCGLRLSCDFVYLPVDFNSGDNLGFSFLNFVTSGAAESCLSLHGDPDGISTGGIGGMCLEVVWAVSQQGLKANIKRYRNNPVMHVSVPDEYKPALFCKGVRVPFPAPKRHIQPPQAHIERAHTSAAPDPVARCLPEI